jgi:lipopolysaccharide/colanic/teichoic acid biosynthesis glycosyltransferase
MLHQNLATGVSAPVEERQARLSEARSHRRLARIWALLGLSAPLCAAAWLPPQQALPWSAAWVAGSLAWALLAPRRSWVKRLGGAHYGGQGQVMAGAVAALVSQSVFAFWVPPALWFAAVALHSVWLVLGFRLGVLVVKPVLVAVGSGRTTDLKKLLGERAEWAELGETARRHVDAFLFDPRAMSQRELAEIDPSIWCHRTFDAGRVLEDLQGRVALADWSCDRVAELSRSRRYERIKRVLDLALVVLSLPVSIPLAGLIALMIRVDSTGPILFIQQRTGRGGRPFRMLKFRSMTTSHDRSPSFTKREDQRITRVGRLLRSNRLDELPQLFNVLTGSMSLVGPRPEQVPFVEVLVKDVPAYHLRHAVKPGITGWAQLEQGYVDSLEGTARKLEYDLYYATRRSLAVDLGILIGTVPALFRGVEAERQSAGSATERSA